MGMQHNTPSLVKIFKSHTMEIGYENFMQEERNIC